jgi:O-antigen/teichoic acid export membrane protein
MWTSLSWIFLPFLSKKWGVNGAALGYAIVGISSFIVFYIIKKMVNWSIVNSVVKPLVAAFFMGAVILFLRNILPYNLYALIILVVIGISSYILILYFIDGNVLVEDIKSV